MSEGKRIVATFAVGLVAAAFIILVISAFITLRAIGDIRTQLDCIQNPAGASSTTATLAAGKLTVGKTTRTGW
jgi:hypothetical protein